MNTALFSEDELVALLKNKDEKAFNYLYDNYSAALFGIVMKTVQDETVAADVLQEVFVKIWKNIPLYDSSKGRLYTWMLNIARNHSIDVVRSKAHQQGQKTIDIDCAVYDGGSTKTVQNNIDTLGLKKQVMSLKPEWRILIDLAYFQGFTQEEIAKTLDVPLGTVKTRLRSAMTALKSVFNK